MSRYLFWYALTLFMIAVRFSLASLLIVSGGLVGISVGLAELVSVFLAILNMRRAMAHDLSSGGVAVTLCYILSLALIPQSGGPEWAGYASLAVLALIVWARLKLWHGYTVGPSSWVSCVDTGPYSIVRHPQLALSILMRVCAVLAWPSSWNVAVVSVFAVSVILVVLVEERFLTEFHPWCEYASRVRWRLVPFVW